MIVGQQISKVGRIKSRGGVLPSAAAQMDF